MCPRYSNTLNSSRRLLANKYVQRVRFNLNSFSTELNYDFLTLETSVGTSWSGSGSSVPTGWQSTYFWGPYLQRNPYLWRFRSDDSNTGTGFDITALDVRCDPTGQSPSLVPVDPAAPYTRETGVLLGQNDVVYTYFPVNPGQTMYVSGWQHPNFTSSANWLDLDIFVKCGSVPTSEYDAQYSSSSSDPREFITLPPVCGSANWYVAVKSFAGSGQFNLVTGTIRSPNPAGMTVGLEWTPSPAEKSQLDNWLVLTSRRLLGMTEGQVLFGNWKYYGFAGGGSGTGYANHCVNRCGAYPCKVCIHAANDLLANNGVGAQVYPDDPLADVHVSRDGFNSADPRLLAHELGHGYLSLGDEYLGPDDGRNTSPPPRVLQTLCGHSMMSIHNGPSNNLCTSWDHGFNRLFTSPHPSSVSPPMPAAWPTLHSLFGFDVPVGTPDNYNYADHDFGGAINVSPP